MIEFVPGGTVLAVIALSAVPNASMVVRPFCPALTTLHSRRTGFKTVRQNGVVVQAQRRFGLFRFHRRAGSTAFEAEI
jgi:hypothetical protein